MFKPLRPISFLLLVTALGCAGCQRTPALELPVAAENAREFAAWQREHRASFSPEEWKEFEQALQDIKVKIIAQREATGPDAVNDGLRPKVHGRTVREVLREGYEARLWRMNVERVTLEELVQTNAKLREAVGESTRGAELARQGQAHAERLKRAVEEIRVVEGKRNALATPVPAK